MLETQKMIEILINIAIFLVIVLVIAICGWINNKNKDKKVHTEYNDINNASNNVLVKAIKKAHSKINNIDEARKFVYEQLNFMYFFYDSDILCKSFIDMSGIPKYEFYNADLFSCDTEASDVIYDLFEQGLAPSIDSKIAMQIITLSVMLKYNIGNSEKIKEYILSNYGKI